LAAQGLVNASISLLSILLLAEALFFKDQVSIKVKPFGYVTYR
jgi:hypothetical protein